MKVFISVDMEGISGLVRWADVGARGVDYGRNRSIMTADANAAIAGALDAGADEVIVEENHGVEDLCNLLMDEIDDRCTVIRGAGRPDATTMSGLDGTCGLVMLVGHHARAGSYPGIMAHTISYGAFERVLVSGRSFGEPDFFIRRAGELGVPVGLVTGDQVVAEQVREIAPWVDAVIVKQALARQSGHCIPPARAQAMIRDGAMKAVARANAGELEAYEFEPGPFDIEVQMKIELSDAFRQNIDSLAEFSIEGDRTVRTTADDMSLAFRRVAYLGYANRPGVTRY